jgi:hypothetical protein
MSSGVRFGAMPNPAQHFRLPFRLVGQMTDERMRRWVARVRRGDRTAAGRLAERYLRGARAVALANPPPWQAALVSPRFIGARDR